MNIFEHAQFAQKNFMTVTMFKLSNINTAHTHTHTHTHTTVLRLCGICPGQPG